MNGAQRLNRALRKTIATFRPPERLTLRQWTEKYRQMSRSVSSAAGPWRTARAPHTAEIMDAYSDDSVRAIAIMLPAQTAKSEILLNIIGYIISLFPCGILYIQPTDEDVKSFSKLRVGPMIKDNPSLRSKVREAKSRDSGNTIKMKLFPGGFLRMVSALSFTNIRSTPCAVVIVDELSGCRDTVEGQLQELIERRTDTFPNSKVVYASTPTIKGACKIEDEFLMGTMERWKHQCECGAWVEARLTKELIKYELRIEDTRGKPRYHVSNIYFSCPHCGLAMTENQVKNRPARYIADNPDAALRGRRSFTMNGMYNRSRDWNSIIVEFQEKHENPVKLQAFKNTVLGELWENRDANITEEQLMERREDYGKIEGTETRADAPNKVLALFCGVDVQKGRLEYEVYGEGWDEESWGIQYGVIYHEPETDAAWEALDDVIDRIYYRADGRPLRVLRTCVDSGFAAKSIVYRRCFERRHKNVVPVKGVSGDNATYIPPPEKISRQALKDAGGVFTVRLFPIGVDEGKKYLMHRLEVQTPGPKYCHFPSHPDAGYSGRYFHGLLAEDYVAVNTSTGIKMRWVVRNGHERNEPFDCRNYAVAACGIERPDWQARERELREWQPGRRTRDMDSGAARESAPSITASKTPRGREQTYKDAW